MDKIMSAEELFDKIDSLIGEMMREKITPFQFAYKSKIAIRSRDKAIVEQIKKAVWTYLYGGLVNAAKEYPDSMGNELMGQIDQSVYFLVGEP